jgi:hypothetical protein
MSSAFQSNGQLVWKELLSAREIEEWAVSRSQPRKLWRVDGHSWPGVYRFVFPNDSFCAGSSFRGPSCYIGVAGHFGTRLRDHICPSTNQKSKNSARNVSGKSVHAAISDSLGKCYLQYLTIEGAVEMCGVKIVQHSFDDLFARLLLENWAIFHAERIEKLPPLNRDIPTGIPQSTKDDYRQAILIKVGPRGTVTKRGGLESLL